jgi:hypothetical protein
MQKFSLNFLLLLVISSLSAISVSAANDGYNRDPKLLQKIASTLCRDSFSVLRAKNTGVKTRSDYIKKCLSRIKYPENIHNKKLVHYRKSILVTICHSEECGNYIFKANKNDLSLSSVSLFRAGTYKGKCNKEYLDMEKESNIPYKIIENSFGKCPQNG